jgi:hypothetical protein
LAVGLRGAPLVRDALDKACTRLNGMFWKGREASCTTTAF